MPELDGLGGMPTVADPQSCLVQLSELGFGADDLARLLRHTPEQMVAWSHPHGTFAATPPLNRERNPLFAAYAAVEMLRSVGVETDEILRRFRTSLGDVPAPLDTFYVDFPNRLAEIRDRYRSELRGARNQRAV